ncbi:hypothetical protein TWF506_005570 [Arthrobotrys conoides]|uniref:Uncharacterized protein n=1 Tax=Arthrobotrys conoides TaxID=74498 RepID=A0AAN8S058_9PEZI
MIRLTKTQRLGVLPLLLFLRVSYISAAVINVVISEVEEVWRENNDDTLRRNRPSQESVLILCRPPPEEPWIGVYAIDPATTSCEANGGSENWVIRKSPWERPEYIPKPPGTVFQIEGPGPAEKDTAYAISNTESKEDYLTFGPILSFAVSSEPSKCVTPTIPHTDLYKGKKKITDKSAVDRWLVERYGKNDVYETIAPDNKLRVGDTLRFWDPEIPYGFQQLYMHRIKGSPQRFNRVRPLLLDSEDVGEDYAVRLAKLRKEYPAAEFRIASIDNSDIFEPPPVSRTQRFLETVGSAKGRIGSFLTGGRFRGQLDSGRFGSEERIPSKKEEQRVRSEEIEIDPGDIFGNPNLLNSISPDEYLRTQQQKPQMELPYIPSLAELNLRKSMKKNSPVQEVIAQFEESKSDNDNDVRRPVEMGRSSKSSHSANSKTNEIGRGRIPTVANNFEEPREETVYQTAFGYGDEPFDYDEEDRLGDIIDDNSNLIKLNPAYQPVLKGQSGTGVVNPEALPPNDQSNA